MNQRSDHLKLVGVDHPDGSGWRDDEQARLAVMKENRLAAHLPGFAPGDPRLVLAAQARARLQGTLLTPEHRGQLLHQGRRLGLRSFETGLVIALVQDQARLESPTPVAPVNATSHGVKKAAEENDVIWPRWFAALAAALALAVVIARLLAG